MCVRGTKNDTVTEKIEREGKISKKEKHVNKRIERKKKNLFLAVDSGCAYYRWLCVSARRCMIRKDNKKRKKRRNETRVRK